MENYWDIPVNTTCQSWFGDSRFNLVGFALFYAISRCVRFKDTDSLGGVGGHGVDEFLTAVANEYFYESPSIVLLYDESWEITEILMKLETNTRKSFVTYFFPVDEALSLRIKSKPVDHFSHKILPKATSFIVFVEDEEGFDNILRFISKYPWWNKRARFVILIKDKSLEPTKGVLNRLEKEKIFNGLVVTQVTNRDGKAGIAFVGADTAEDIDSEDDQASTNKASLQIAALDPYPAPGGPKQFFVARWVNSGFSARTRPLFQDKIDNLRGHRLEACVFEFPPLVMWEETSPKKFEYTGLEVKIFQELAVYINFTYHFYELKGNDRWGVQDKDGDWNGLIGEVATSKADIGFASVFLVDNREKVVDVSTPYDQDRGCFAVPRPEALQHWLGLVLPFSWQVWACMLSMAFIAGPLFSAITRPLNMDESISIGRGIFYALGAMVSSRKPPKAKSSSLRSIIIAWLLFCWLSCILYRVALIVSLTIGPQDYRIDTMKQLVRSGLRWGGFEEVLKTFSNTTSKQDKIFLKRFQPQTDIRRALDRVSTKGDFAVMDSSKFLHYAAKGIYNNGYSSTIHVTKECPTYYNVGFVLPVGSPYLERINQLIRLMVNAGLVQKWLEDIQYRAFLKNPNKNRKRKDQGLTVGHLKLCFVMVLGGCFCAFIAFLWENFMDWRSTKKLKIIEILKEHTIDLKMKKRERRTCHNCRRKMSKISLTSNGTLGEITSDLSSNPSIAITDTDHEDHKDKDKDE